MRAFYFLTFSTVLLSLGNAGPNPDMRKFVLRGYDKLAIPGDGSTPVTVQASSLTITALSVNEKDQQLTLHGWLALTWLDSRLSWANSESKNNEGYLHFSNEEVWTPDLAIFNGVQPSNMFDFYGKGQVLSQHNGSVLWVPPIKIKSHCELNLRHWPYDKQTCRIVIGSWTYSDTEINVTLSENSSEQTPISFEHSMLNNTEWHITESNLKRQSKEYDCCPGQNYPSITIELTMKRKSCSYFYTIMLPLLTVTIINIVIFLLPKTRGEKLLLGVFNFLVVSLYLLYFQTKLPFLVSTPAIVMLFGANLFFISLIIAISVMVINFTDGTALCGTPKWTHWIFNRTVATFLCLRTLQKITNAKRDGRSYSFKGSGAGNGNVAVEDPMIPMEPQPKTKETDGGNKAEWIYLAAFVDRVALLTYIQLTLALFVYVHL